jgi:hypothetical protein
MADVVAAVGTAAVGMVDVAGAVGMVGVAAVITAA